MSISVLIADDHAIFRTGLTQALSGHDGIKIVAEASSIAEAETMADKIRPDILLLDLWMQRASSIGRISAIVERCPLTRIVVLTASENYQDIAAAMEAGAVGYVTKDTEPKTLVTVIRSVHAGQTYVSSQSLTGWLSALKQAAREGPTKRMLASLTEQERLVLSRVGAGKNNTEISRELGIGIPTVKYHLSKIFAKLGVRNRVEAAVLARDLPSGEGEAELG